MDKKQIEEKGRYAFIRERANQMQEKSRHKPYVPGLFTVIDETISAEQRDADAEENSPSAENAAHEVIAIARYSKGHTERNASHRETHFGQAAKNSTTSRFRMIQDMGRKAARNKTIDKRVHKQRYRESRLHKLKLAVQRGARKSAGSALIAGLGALLLLLPLLLLFGAAGAMFGGSADVGNMPVSEEVKAYAGLIQAYALEAGIPEYTGLIAAVMMQESGGLGSDPMQASESGFNTEYPKAPGSISDPEYSIKVGIQALADCLDRAEAESPEDIEHISLALQGYNFGSGYISWAVRNYGGYTPLNAAEFSEMMAAQMGWTGYGDPLYVQHVLRYYRI